jgi:hypothetical protein
MPMSREEKGSASFPLGKLEALSLSKRQLAGHGILPWPLPSLTE